ncbi:MAG: HrpE/YscL family type III secretion apparatus protein [Succinivibrionaceae bacterium]|nr:HrpE/YscL family type III secretion apparatus protein [Succinivibrionaceae bacterium]
MPKSFYSLKEGFSLSPGRRVIPAGDYADFLNAEDMLAQVRSAVEKAKAQAEQVYRKRYDEGYQDGLEAGKAEYAEKMIDMVMTSVDSIESLEGQLVDVVTESVTKILGEFDPQDRVRRTVRQALNSVRGSKTVTIRVCAQEEPLARNALGSFLGVAESSGYVDLRIDANLRPGDCVLETEMGVVDSSIESQLRILREALERHLVAQRNGKGA